MTNTLSDDFINELITCEKKITLPPEPKKKTNGHHKESDVQIESVDGKYHFSAFIREHIDLVEFFSVGLLYWPDGSAPIRITRYNGQHGEHRNKLTREILKGCFHIHKYKAEAVEAGYSCDNEASATDKYATINQALRLFFNDVKVLNFADYFPELMQEELL